MDGIFKRKSFSGGNFFGWDQRNSRQKPAGRRWEGHFPEDFKECEKSAEEPCRGEHSVCAYQTERQKDYVCLSVSEKEGFYYQQYIPCLDPLGEKEGQNPWSLTPEIYGEALKSLFDLWFEDIRKGTMVSIREFDNWLSMLKGFPPEACSQTGRCSMQNIIEADGGVYPCDFYVLDNCRIANVQDEKFRFSRGSFRKWNFSARAGNVEKSVLPADGILFAGAAAEEIIQRKIRIISASLIRNFCLCYQQAGMAGSQTVGDCCQLRQSLCKCGL